MTRIAIRDSTDSYNIDFFDNTNGIKYHLADLEVYAQGSAFLDLKYYSKTQIVDVGMRLAFVFRGKDYWTTVTSVGRESEYEYQVEARSLSLEALREVRSSYKASRNMTFEEYLNVFDPERSIRLNVNTIANRSRKLEWTGEDTILARILSLATKFDAEIEFETELNDDYSLKEFRLNVHALNELGKDRTGIPFRISNSQLKLIKFKSSIDEFYSAIRGTGKDGLTISGLDKKVYDDEKKLLFYTSGGTIYAPQARDKFISITNKKTSDGYIVREFDSTEHETKETLYAYMLGELKKHCEPQIDYTIDGYIDADVNDKVLLIDDKYTTDDLMLTARVNKQKWSLIDKLQGSNRTELSNYVRVYSEIADELITRMNALIEANKVYDVQILTSNGYTFKNGQGSTTLTARVMDGPRDVTSEFSLTWFKNSTEYAHTASINVQAGSIDELATYLIIAEKDGRERGRNELTVFNVKDGQPGKTPVVHLAWADSADGTVKFTTELPTNWIPKYRGYYVDYSSVASTNPKLYKWERNPDDAAKVADEAKSKADSANTKADSANSKADNAVSVATDAQSKLAVINKLANTANELAKQADDSAKAAEKALTTATTNLNNAKIAMQNATKEFTDSLEQTKTSFTEQIGGLTVGGRNLFLDAAFKSGKVLAQNEYTVGNWHVWDNKTSYSLVDYNNLKYFKYNARQSEYRQGIMQFFTPETLQRKTHSVRTFVKVSQPMKMAFNVIKKNTDGSINWYFDVKTFDIQPSDTFSEMKWQFKIPETDDGVLYGVAIVNVTGNINCDICIYKPMLEAGTLFSDFVLAPEDYNNDLSNMGLSLTKTITDSLERQSEEFTKTYLTKADNNTWLNGSYKTFHDQTSEYIKQSTLSFETLGTDVGDAKTNAQNALTSATNAVSAANAANTTASGASGVASSAVSTANAAKSAASSAVSTANAAKKKAEDLIGKVNSFESKVTTYETNYTNDKQSFIQETQKITTIQNKLDNMYIGGRNLFVDAGFKKEVKIDNNYDTGYWYSYVNTKFNYPKYDDDCNYLYFTASNNDSFGVMQFFDTNKLIKGQTYSVRTQVKVDANTTFRYQLVKKNQNSSYDWYFNYSDTTVTTTGEWVDVKWTFTIPKNDNAMRYGVAIRNLQTGTETALRILKPKLEIGNMYTGFSLAPEDTQLQIDTISNDLSNNYYSKNQINTEVINGPNGVISRYTQDITNRLGNYYTTSQIDSKINIDGEGISEYVKRTQSQLNNLSIGNENLLADAAFKDKIAETNASNYVDGKWVKYNGGTIDIWKYSNEINGIKFEPTQGLNTGVMQFINANYMQIGKEYCLRFYVFCRKPITVNSYLMTKSGDTITWYRKTLISKNITQYGTYVEVSTKFKLEDFGSVDLYGVSIFVSGTADNVGYPVWIMQPKFEQGNVFTNFSISTLSLSEQGLSVIKRADKMENTLYDTTSGLVTKTTQLAGKYAIQNLNSSGDILTSLNLNANDQTAEINAKLIRLNGYTKMDDAFINNLVANSILTEKIKSTEISGDIIKGGTIQGVNVRTSDGRNLTDLSNGGLTLTRTEPIESNFLQHHYGIVYPTSITMSVWDVYSGQPTTLNGKTTFDPSGFYNVTKDSGGVLRKRSLIFNSEGIGITPENIHASDDIVNTGDSLNTGIRLYGKRAYLDLNGNQTSYAPGTVSRIISEPDGRMEIINYAGNIHLNTRNGENPISNGYKIPYTWAENTQGIKYFRVIRPNESGSYVEISNHVGKVWGISMWLSDQRLKSSLQSPTKDALATLNKLQIRQFDWKSDNVHEDFGLVAQEVEQVLPNAVFKVGDYYQIKDSGLIPVLIGAVQKLSNKVNLLENIIYNTKGSNLL